jgi:hypothetical protein
MHKKLLPGMVSGQEIECSLPVYDRSLCSCMQAGGPYSLPVPSQKSHLPVPLHPEHVTYMLVSLVP